ncbi:uncharacterized protein LOC127867586 [Dreissena polymorpha]|uniref:uncharacterized protein LOC127867586 n=1 Tax=Dreissena polymorpha TaxID=45954 RepID=UPI0022654E27|nr:uncharacterized protein LOC127867586 [Dreissena polymorpha]
MDTYRMKYIVGILSWTGVLMGGATAFLFTGSSDCACPAHFDGSTRGFAEKTYSRLRPDENVVNPGRGFYKSVEAHSSRFDPITSSSLGTHNNVVFRHYYLNTYLDQDLPTTFTEKIKADLKVIQGKGWTVLLRFSYSECCEHPPYPGPSYSRMLSHIKKLDNEHVFRDYEGIIVAIQAGFIGAWGEWHYTTNEFGIPGSCTSTSAKLGLNDNQWANRQGIIQALLDAAPPSIEILIRIPAFKFHYYGRGVTTFSDEQNHTNKSRIGFHNDAFLSDLGENQGTFICPDDRSYMVNESLYNYVTGETNTNQTPTAWTCTNAKKELSLFHYSSLNTDYLPQIIASWKDNGCYDVISAHLGYRLYLTKAIIPSSVAAGGEFCYHIEINNEGYAAPNKEMEAHIVLENTGNHALISVMVPGVDVRKWLPNKTQTLHGTAVVPPIGHYKVHFVLLNKVLGKNSKYFVLMANGNGVQNNATRMNSLGLNVDVISGQCNSQTAAPAFQPWQQTGHGCAYKIADGSFEGHGWSPYKTGYVTKNDGAQNGNHYISVTNGGAYQDIVFNGSSVTSFELSGWSRAHSASVSNPADYSIYCDLTYADGTAGYGNTANYDVKHTTWYKVVLSVHTKQAIHSARCYAMFRYGHGTADFDNFRLETCA